MSLHPRTEDVLHGLAAVLGDHGRMSPESLEERVLNTFARLSESEAESVTNALGNVGQFFKSSGVKNVAGTALPIIGTAVGTAYGGPVGAAIGGSLGSAAGQAVAGKRPKAAPTTPAGQAPTKPDEPPASHAVPSPSGPSSVPPAPASGAEVGSAAAAQLLSVIQNPALLASLLSLVMGSSGKNSVPAGSNGTDVPVGAMMNLLSVLANRAASDAEEILAARQEAPPAYLLDESGCLTCDPAVPSERAEALLRVLSTSSESLSEEAGPDQYPDAWDDPNWW